MYVSAGEKNSISVTAINKRRAMEAVLAQFEKLVSYENLNEAKAMLSSCRQDLIRRYDEEVLCMTYKGTLSGKTYYSCCYFNYSHFTEEEQEILDTLVGRLESEECEFDYSHTRKSYVEEDEDDDDLSICCSSHEIKDEEVRKEILQRPNIVKLLAAECDEEIDLDDIMYNRACCGFCIFGALRYYINELVEHGDID